jgi:hypothetical protein
MTTTTYDDDTVRSVPVSLTIDCPDWCNEDHMRRRALGVGDIWHRQRLAGDENSHVDLVLCHLAVEQDGPEQTPEVAVVLDGNFVVVDRENMTAGQVLRLAAMIAEATDGLEVVERGEG